MEATRRLGVWRDNKEFCEDTLSILHPYANEKSAASSQTCLCYNGVYQASLRFHSQGGISAMKDMPTPEDFCLRSPLYEMFRIGNWNFKRVIQLELFQGTMDAYCLQCKKEGVFNATKSPGILRDSPAPSGNYPLAAGKEIVWVDAEHFVWGLEKGPDTAKEYALSDRMFGVRLVCSRDTSHMLRFLFVVQDAQIAKIGQYPSLADLQEWEIRKYRKILGDDKYNEFSKAVGLAAHGVGIGAFVYLRRIFEGLIEEAHTDAKVVPDWDEESFVRGTRMDDKILMLRDFLPDFLMENRGIYSILSKGIHTLSEEECLDHFDILKTGVELILDEKIEKTNKAAKVSQVSNNLASLKGKLKA